MAKKIKISGDKTPQSEKSFPSTAVTGHAAFIDARPKYVAQLQLMETMRQGQQAQTGLAKAKMIQASSSSNATAQLAWAPRNYSLNDTQRRLHVDHHDVRWGATDPNNWPNRAGQRAIVYETIATTGRIGASTARFSNIAGNMHDAGLTIVLNAPYVHATDNKIRANNAPAVNAPVAVENSEAQVKANLNVARNAALNNWDGPPINISTLAWERKY